MLAAGLCAGLIQPQRGISMNRRPDCRFQHRVRLTARERQTRRAQDPIGAPRRGHQVGIARVDVGGVEHQVEQATMQGVEIQRSVTDGLQPGYRLVWGGVLAPFHRIRKKHEGPAGDGGLQPGQPSKMMRGRSMRNPGARGSPAQGQPLGATFVQQGDARLDKGVTQGDWGLCHGATMSALMGGVKGRLDTVNLRPIVSA